MKAFAVHGEKPWCLTLSPQQLTSTLVTDQRIEVIMAEQAHENADVLALATAHWLAYGLVYPNAKVLSHELLEQSFPKVFLLHTDDPVQGYFRQYGMVVFDRDEYEREVERLMYHGAFE